MKRAAVAGLTCIALLTGMSACANPSIGDPSRTGAAVDLVAAVQKDNTIAAMLPVQYTAEKGFTVSINADVEPIKYIDSNGEVAGLNPDLLRAAAKVLGTKAEFPQGSFDALVPGLEANRFDVIASVADFVERQKKIDFIDYLKNGTAILTNADFAKSQVTLGALCGLSVGYARGSSQQGSLEKAAATCKADGKPALTINGYNDTSSGILSVKSREADAFWGDLPQMAYNAKKNPDLFKVVYKEQVSILGIGINKKNPKLRDALRAALLKLVADGTYQALLEKWGLQDSALPQMDVNSQLSQAKP